MFLENPDIPESQLPTNILTALLHDHTTGQNIIWATDDYEHLGNDFNAHHTIEPQLITGPYEGIIKPRALKTKTIQINRAKDKAEVFTPAWICNIQNNLIDEQWFGRKNVFNQPNNNHTWTTNRNKITFPDLPGKTWRDYVKDTRLEITCGEAPYLTSRYDTVTGQFIQPLDRIGLFDRKCRIVLENYGPGTEDKKWFKWMRIALQATYAYEYQGDNLLLARENILSTYIRFFMIRFGKKEYPPDKILNDAIDVITWNIWQMDGLKGVIPDTCHETRQASIPNMFTGKQTIHKLPCPGCNNNNIQDMHLHNGIPCKIKDWDLTNDGKRKKIISFHELLKEHAS